MRNPPGDLDSQAGVAAGPYRVLAVDDEEASLFEIRDMLAMDPRLAVVGAFTDPRGALESLDDRVHLDCAFLDIRMPAINGFELGERLSHRYPSLLIVYVTAYNDYATEAFDIDAVDYVLKPVRKDRLQRAVDRIVDRIAGRVRAAGARLDAGAAGPGGGVAPVRVQAFGRLEILVDGVPARWPTKKSTELFGYLLHQRGRYVSKDKIVDDLWPDQTYEKALVNLHTTVYRARQTLGDLDDRFSIDYENGSYRLKMPGVDSDLAEFEAALEGGTLQPDKPAESLERAVKVYAGDYFEEQSYIWSVDVQEALRQKYVGCLRTLASLHLADGTPEKAIPLLETAVLKNPYDPRACDLLFRTYRLAGDVSSMVAFYEKARGRLAKGFGKKGLLLIEERFRENYREMTGKTSGESL